MRMYTNFIPGIKVDIVNSFSEYMLHDKHNTRDTCEEALLMLIRRSAE